MNQVKVISHDIPTLEKILDYKNDNIILRFRSLYDLNENFVKEIFEHVKMFMWVSHKMLIEKGIFFVILKEQILLDEMWHNFILFTKEYHDYCYQCYGEYIHHQPSSAADKFNPNFINELKETMYYVEENLGMEVLQKWYKEWPEKYTKEYLLKHLVRA